MAAATGTRLTPSAATTWARRLEGKEPREILDWAGATFPGTVGYACSFGAEAMVLIDIIARQRCPIRVFTIDTGRLPQETFDLMERVRRRYDLAIDVFVPKHEAVERFVTLHGPNGFRRSLTTRLDCCQLRKVEPLERALRGLDAWITGVRRAQSPTRGETPVVALDTAHGNIVKIAPLAGWSRGDVWRYLRRHRVPYNALHDRRYASIGCAPCTRPVAAGEDERAGRWWWEQGGPKECGLHLPGGSSRNGPHNSRVGELT